MSAWIDLESNEIITAECVIVTDGPYGPKWETAYPWDVGTPVGARLVQRPAPECTCCRKLPGAPTEPGWYWQISTGCMYTGPRQLEAVDIRDGWPGAFPGEVTWYGPIPEPEGEREEKRNQGEKP